MKKICPHCGHDVGEMWHIQYGIQKLDRGRVEAGIPVVGRITLDGEAFVMAYV